MENFDVNDVRDFFAIYDNVIYTEIDLEVMYRFISVMNHLYKERKTSHLDWLPLRIKNYFKSADKQNRGILFMNENDLPITFLYNVYSYSPRDINQHSILYNDVNFYYEALKRMHKKEDIKFYMVYSREYLYDLVTHYSQNYWEDENGSLWKRVSN